MAKPARPPQVRVRHIVRVGLALSMLLAGAALCWFAAGMVADAMGARELRQTFDARRQLAEQVADGMASQITADVALLRAVPLTLAEIESIPAGVARVDTRRWNLMDEGLRLKEATAHPEVRAASTFLSVANGNLGLDYTWVVDTRGYVVLASNAGRPGSFIGMQLALQPYMKAAMLGGLGEQFTVGPITGVPGLFFAAPIYDAQGRLVAAIGTKVNLSRLQHWVSHPTSLVADANGLIILSTDASLVGKALPDSRVQRMTPSERFTEYQRVDFEPWSYQAAASAQRAVPSWVPADVRDAMVWRAGSEIPSLTVSRTASADLTVMVAEPLGSWSYQLATHERNRSLGFVLFLSGLLVFVLVVWSLLRERQHHRVTRHLNQSLQRTNSALANEAHFDHLTGVLTRRRFLALFETVLTRTHVRGEQLVLVLADLDHFKRINDTWGHAVGDLALQRFASLATSVMRSSDLIGRLGGEEFAVVMSRTTLEEAAGVVERLRAAVAEADASLPSGLAMTVSLGMTACHPGDTASEMLRRADLALYRAKESGRNRHAAG
ncbi:sensor domain-containing diguanylate cyclase [Ralstonia pseudosolanacearum]|uniref:diguanylate cyclase n=3 Tax=Ralstonia solanacearum species complex TaxID=3116862 RepID=A0A0S4WAL4_RALSL|nr:sensor domain-containing diguanylate cyclase [Ralstonia pseudosolanacearum]AVV68077.1 GGDEF domain-containing protein [Ralstonia solanacearum OE1-1]AZU55266.1 GGDEF domain-containing protein [Ralstonia solanacearum]API73965.1 diguanylate cyclase [Ralstonia pseudosolanacearum]MBX9428444.1 diguanylate cyclase [Ralstonia pseudosolanacearum]MCK4137368.1 diguanylate cyclase [Ralstonia pseudosolanacearum]